MRLNSCSNRCSLTESAVGLTCWACAGAGSAKPATRASASAAITMRIRAMSVVMLGLRARLRSNGFAIGGLPAPGAGAVAALAHAVPVDLGDDLAVAREQRLGRAHLGAQRQLALGQPIGAVFLELGLA